MCEGRGVGGGAEGGGEGVGDEYRLFGRRKRGCVDEVCERAKLDGVGVMGWS